MVFFLMWPIWLIHALEGPQFAKAKESMAEQIQI